MSTLSQNGAMILWDLSGNDLTEYEVNEPSRLTMPLVFTYVIDLNKFTFMYIHANKLRRFSIICYKISYSLSSDKIGHV